AAQLVVRWGSGEGEKEQARHLAGTDSARAPIVQAPEAGSQVTAEDLGLVKNLVRALAQDIRTRDRQQQEALWQMQARFDSFLDQVGKYVAANERDEAG